MPTQRALLIVLHQYLDSEDDGQILEDLELLGVEVKDKWQVVR